MSPAAQSVVRRLDALRQKWWVFTLLTSAVLAGCVSFGLLLGLMLADALIVLPQIVLAVMSAIWLAVTLMLVVLVYRRLGGGQRSLEATARCVEAEYPELGSNLINLVQLSEDTQNTGRAFRAAAINQSAAGVGHIRLEEAAERQGRWQRFLCRVQTPRDLSESFAALGVLIVVAMVCQLLIPNWGSAAGRLLSPWEFVPSVGSAGEIEVTPGDTEVLVGSSLAITGRIKNPDARPYEATLWIRPEGEDESGLPMAADKKNRRYRLTLPSLVKPLEYRLAVGDSQSRIFAVGVRRKPTIDEVEVTYHFPVYLGRPAETTTQKHADLQAPQYTVAELKIRPSVPVAKGYVESGNRKFTGRVEQGGKLLVVKGLPMVENGTFIVHMENDAGHSDPNPRVNRIRVLHDRPPTVQLLKPPRQSSASPASEVAVTIRGGDDHGIGRVRLEMKIDNEKPNDDNTPTTTLKQWNRFQGNTTVVLHYRLELDPKLVEPGQAVLLRAVAWDKRYIDISQWGYDLKPQQAASPWHVIRVVDRLSEANSQLQQLDELRQAIYKILIRQIRARAGTAQIARTEQAEQLARALNLAREVRGRQLGIQKTTAELVKSIGQTQSDQRLSIKRVLNRLAFGEMLEAVRQCDILVKINSAGAFARPVAELDATQQRIIDVLRKLLEAVRRAEARVLAEMDTRPGGDLPDDTRKKLQEAVDKLGEFLRQQKKVIEATENLAKMPVEDFTEEEEELLKKLAAAQDDWSRLMKELHSDLSKLAEQDFANPSMLEELVEIQTELKMAEDALLKKTADIAVPLEQLGAEMAEELKTNMEKWLPDSPDRERWSQEESLTDQDKEAPMAELPGELEDLIGELMEEEEDLFDEMEDASSSAADSLDAGAGWDAMDGPISNMSAKGVTGNRLPNTSEMSGRSGEGRTGKSSGEFVGEEAVGKGGRKTPSRLTPDAFEKGQVKDHSKDPMGGATGGGKESGQGAEGLEGPQRRHPGHRNLQRLAGKQAALRNKAEGVDLKFRIMNFQRTDLKKMIELMAQVERDLKAGRYQNALRQRKVLAEGLGNVKQYLEGEFHIRRDTTANLPADIQKDILGGMQDPSPVGWEELNRQYFQRLTGSGADTDAEPD